MHKILFFFAVIAGCGINRPKPEGAYENMMPLTGDSLSIAKDNSFIHTMTMINNGYWISTSFNQDLFLKCSGGRYKTTNNAYIQTFDFNSLDSSVVGKEYPWNFTTKDNKYLIEGIGQSNVPKGPAIPAEFTRVRPAESLKNSLLEGVWKMHSGQGGYTMNFDEVIRIYAYPCFSRTFYNSRRKKFINTYGGTYQFDGEILTEKIEYSSSDITIGSTMEWTVKKLPGDQLQLFDIDSYYDEEIWDPVH